MTRERPLAKPTGTIRYARRQPHGNIHNDWRSARDRRSFARADAEAACRLAIAAFMQQQGQSDRMPERLTNPSRNKHEPGHRGEL